MKICGLHLCQKYNFKKVISFLVVLGYVLGNLLYSFSLGYLAKLLDKLLLNK
jgi:hypothetical protein